MASRRAKFQQILRNFFGSLSLTFTHSLTIKWGRSLRDLPHLGFAAGQVGTTRASRHSVNPQQICFAEIRKYKNNNSSWLVGVQSFSKFEETFLDHFHFHSLTFTHYD